GVGALLVRRESRLRPMLHGGHQQQGRRPGTEPVPLAVGMAVALEWSCANLEAHRGQVHALREHLLERLRHDAAPIVVNGSDAGRKSLPATLFVVASYCGKMASDNRSSFTLGACLDTMTGLARFRFLSFRSDSSRY